MACQSLRCRALNKKPHILYLFATILAYFALWIFIPKATFLPYILRHIEIGMRHAHGPSIFFLSLAGMLLLTMPTVLFMAVQVAVIYFYSKIRMNGWQALSALLGCLAGIVIIVAIMVPQAMSNPKAAAILKQLPMIKKAFVVMGFYPHPLKMPMYMLIMLAAASIGYLVSLVIRDKNLLLPVVIFAAFTDYWTVYHGPVASVIKKAPEVVSAVSTPIPKAGTGMFVPATMMGMGDPLFIALVFACIHKFNMKGARNYWFIFGAMTLGMVAVLMGLLQSLPALTVLALAVIIANWKEFKLSRQEKIAMGVVAVVIAVTLPLVSFTLKPSEAAKPKPKQEINTHVHGPAASPKAPR